MLLFIGGAKMLNISKESNATSLTVILEGRLDTTTAPDLEKELKDSLDDVTELIMDFEKLEYISSAGLRVLLSAQKIMSRQGEMKLIHVSDTIMEIFEVTGFADILTIE
jgi:anti-sigma B factor antagonist